MYVFLSMSKSYGKDFFFFPLNWHWIGGTGDTEESEECVCVISFFFFFFKATTIYSIRVGNKLGQSDGLAFLLPLKICFYLRNKLYGMHFSRRTINYVQFSVVRERWREGGSGVGRALLVCCGWTVTHFLASTEASIFLQLPVFQTNHCYIIFHIV